MIQTITIDSKTIVVKAESENELNEVVDFIASKRKKGGIQEFLEFASQHRCLEKGYKFNRDELYEDR